MVPKAEEPKDLGRTWSLINRINQKGRRPQNKPVLLDDLPAEVLALIGKPYPELLAVGSRVSQFLDSLCCLRNANVRKSVMKLY